MRATVGIIEQFLPGAAQGAGRKRSHAIFHADGIALMDHQPDTPCSLRALYRVAGVASASDFDSLRMRYREMRVGGPGLDLNVATVASLSSLVYWGRDHLQGHVAPQRLARRFVQERDAVRIGSSPR